MSNDLTASNDSLTHLWQSQAASRQARVSVIVDDEPIYQRPTPPMIRPSTYVPRALPPIVRTPSFIASRTSEQTVAHVDRVALHADDVVGRVPAQPPAAAADVERVEARKATAATRVETDRARERRVALVAERRAVRVEQMSSPQATELQQSMLPNPMLSNSNISAAKTNEVATSMIANRPIEASTPLDRDLDRPHAHHMISRPRHERDQRTDVRAAANVDATLAEAHAVDVVV